jgi:hypothetical protein
LPISLIDPSDTLVNPRDTLETLDTLKNLNSLKRLILTIGRGDQEFDKEDNHTDRPVINPPISLTLVRAKNYFLNPGSCKLGLLEKQRAHQNDNDNLQHVYHQENIIPKKIKRTTTETLFNNNPKLEQLLNKRKALQEEKKKHNTK